MDKLFDSDFLKKLQQLAIISKTVQTTMSVGNRKSRSKGSSIEFSDYREYVMGDDFRHVDWNAYGRFEKFFIKLFMEEREAAVHIFVDTSKSMDWGEPNKNIVSRRMAAALGYMSLAKNDMVSVICVNGNNEESRSALRGKNSFIEVMRLLEGAEYKGSTNLLGAIADAPIKSDRGVSIIISDLLPPEGLLDSIKLLQFRKQEVYICHILSPQELNPVIDTDLRLVDSETGAARDIAMSTHLLKAYMRAFQSYIRDIEEMCLKRAASYIRVSSDLAPEVMLRRVAGLL